MKFLFHQIIGDVGNQGGDTPHRGATEGCCDLGRRLIDGAKMYGTGFLLRIDPNYMFGGRPNFHVTHEGSSNGYVTDIPANYCPGCGAKVEITYINHGDPGWAGFTAGGEQGGEGHQG